MQTGELDGHPVCKAVRSMHSIAQKYIILSQTEAMRYQRAIVHEAKILMSDYRRAADSYHARGDTLMATVCQLKADVLDELLERIGDIELWGTA